MSMTYGELFEDSLTDKGLPIPSGEEYDKAFEAWLETFNGASALYCEECGGPIEEVFPDDSDPLYCGRCLDRFLREEHDYYYA